MNNWINIISFYYPHEAHVAKSLLESEDIDVIVKDELTAQVVNFYSNGIGGVKLFVNENNAKRAYAILKEGGYIQEPQVNPSKPKKLEIYDIQHTSVCPYCNSENVAKKNKAGYIAMLSLILFFLPLPITKDEYYCYDCEKDWRIK